MFVYKNVYVDIDSPETTGVNAPQLFTCDFRSIMKPNFVTKYPALMKYGVMCYDGNIFIAKHARNWYKALAFIHEALCMDGCEHPDHQHCKNVEKFVIGLIDSGKVTGINVPEPKELHEKYVSLRIQMLSEAAKVNKDPEVKKSLKETIKYLRTI